ncbi:Very short patch repair protein [bioreactor metagenome]|uniref:Very short patch repair protein n=1 Tax=bioreactor metagenome TaxID=1076179 RepID=A0A645IYR2_9ZZZZ
MSMVRNKNTKPELVVRRFLHKNGFRFRLHRKDLPGHPDIVLPKYRTVIFIHGCFWHRHEGCKRCTTPATNVDFWQRKFTTNIERDKNAREALEKCGWRVIIIWECELKVLLADDRLSHILAKIKLHAGE